MSENTKKGRRGRVASIVSLEAQAQKLVDSIDYHRDKIEKQNEELAEIRDKIENMNSPEALAAQEKYLADQEAKLAKLKRALETRKASL